MNNTEELCNCLYKMIEIKYGLNSFEVKKALLAYSIKNKDTLLEILDEPELNKYRK